MTEPELRVIVCLPKDTSDLPKVDVPIPKATDLYSSGTCENCPREIWIGPRQMQALEMDRLLIAMGVHKYGPLRVLCYVCAIVEAAKFGEDVPVTGLGGGYKVEGNVIE